MIKPGPSINLCVVAVAIIVIILHEDTGGRFITFYHERMYKDTRLCSILGVSSSTRWIARHISVDIFFRQRKEISDDLAEAHPPPLSSRYIPRPLSPPVSFLSCFPVGFFSFLTSSVDGVSQSTLDSNGFGVSRSRGSPSVSATYDAVSHE